MTAPRTRSPKASTKSVVAREHLEWLRLIDVSGPFLSMNVLLDAFPQGLPEDDTHAAQTLRNATAAWEEARGASDEQSIHTEYVRTILERVLDYAADDLLTGPEITDQHRARIAEHQLTLAPDYVLTDGSGDARLLINGWPRSQRLDGAVRGAKQPQSPQERMRLLLRDTAARGGPATGLITNGVTWTLVHVPKDRTTTFASFQSDVLYDTPVLRRAFRGLLEYRRVTDPDPDQSLAGLLHASRDDEREVTDQLGTQVRHAVELIVEALDQADTDTTGELLQGIDEYHIYEGAVSVAMRLIFLLAAEAQGLLPDDGPWVESYAITPLLDALTDRASLHGEEVLDGSYDAWPRLLATFRAIHGGVTHDQIRLPGYGGGMFDPARFPFLEGTHDHNVMVPNRIIHTILRELLELEVAVPGGARERRRLSYRALSVEQIGYVYERLLDHEVRRADGPVLGLTGNAGKEPEIALADLEAAADSQPPDESKLLALVKELTGRGPGPTQKLLSKEPSLAEQAQLRDACGNDTELYARVAPYWALLRTGSRGLPIVIGAGRLYVTESDKRHSSGAHYTPPSLTEEIVRFALEPICYIGPAEGLARADWTLKTPHELLALRVCDIAMGSAAFLVAACRYLGEHLLSAWDEHPEQQPAGLPLDVDERRITAMRLVAERCLYGVDINPLAVEIAKLSMWLVTLRKDQPFTFLDHCLRCGDSLLGLTSLEQLEGLSLTGDIRGGLELDPAREAIRSRVADVRRLREQIEATDAVDLTDIDRKHQLLARSDSLLDPLRAVGDLVVSAHLLDAERGGGESLLLASADQLRRAIELGEGAGALASSARSAAARAGVASRPFHWSLEFAEVWTAGGFDAVVGNPPFLGGLKIGNAFGTNYRSFLVSAIAKGRRGTADFASYFVLRATEILDDGGELGLITTNTVAQGDTREIGLQHLLGQGWFINRATTSQSWPGDAAVSVVKIWLSRRAHPNPCLDGSKVHAITSHLLARGRVDYEPVDLKSNEKTCYQGSILLGSGFVLNDEQVADLVDRDAASSQLIKRAINSSDVAQRAGSIVGVSVIDTADLSLEQLQVGYPAIFAHLDSTVRVERSTNSVKSRRERWWRWAGRVSPIYDAVLGREYAWVIPRVSKWMFVDRVSADLVFTNRLYVLTDSSPMRPAIMSSSVFKAWQEDRSYSLGQTGTFSPTDCYLNFPFASAVKITDVLASLGANYVDVRCEVRKRLGLSVTDLYNLAYEAFDQSEEVERLRNARIELDRAVLDSLGWEDLDVEYSIEDHGGGGRWGFSRSLRIEVIDRLLECNRVLARAEAGECTARALDERISLDKANDTSQLSFD